MRAPPFVGDVPPGHYLMMGDNRDNSDDGRVLGLRAGGEPGRQGDPDLVQLGPAPLRRPDLEPHRLGDSVTGHRGVTAMRNRQRGVTAIGWLILLTPFAIVIYAGIRLAPVYLNYMKVAKALDQAGNEVKAGGASPTAIKTAIDKHFEIDMVEYPEHQGHEDHRDGADWVIECQLRRRGTAVRQRVAARHLRQGREDQQRRQSLTLVPDMTSADWPARVAARPPRLRAARPGAVPRRADPSQRRRPQQRAARVPRRRGPQPASSRTSCTAPSRTPPKGT